MEYSNLSVDELKRHLEDAENKKAEVNRILEVRRNEGKDDVIKQLRDIIVSNGYQYDEIVPFIKPKRGRGRARGFVVTPKKYTLLKPREYNRYVDPDNPDHVYVRGVLPGWMKQKMQEQGYDFTSKDDREAFKKNSLRLLKDD